MNRQKELAVRVVELANDFTGWNFKREKVGNVYLVRTTLENQDGQKVGILYSIGEEEAELAVFSKDSGYDESYATKRINEIPQDCPLYINEMGKEGISINSLIPLEFLDNQTGTVVMKIMVNMMQAVTDIINSHK